MTSVVFKDVTKSYGDRIAVQSFETELRAGSWCLVVGPNGSGKTTLLGLTAGLLEPTKGAVLIGAAPAGTRAAREVLSYFSDPPAFYSDLTVAEHIDYVAGIYDDPTVADRAVACVEAFGLADRADDLPDTFSRGMKQKTALALALARPASVFLLDEPTRGLDVAGAETLVALLRERRAQGATIITVTHEPERFTTVDGVLIEANEGHLSVRR